MAPSAVSATASASVMDPELMMSLRAVCVATGFALHVVPLVTMRQVWDAGSTMNFHISTYAFALLNQAVNLWYATVREDSVLSVHRAFGVAFNAYYVYNFVTYAPPGRAAEFKRTLVRAAALFALVAVDLLVALPALGWGPQYHFGHIAFFGAMTGIGLAAGPLATVGEVLRTKDASSLPLPFLAMVTIQCTAWTLYGYLQSDLSTFANNLVGVVLGGLQLILIAMYPSKRAAPSSSVGKKREGDTSASEGGPSPRSGSPGSSAGSASASAGSGGSGGGGAGGGSSTSAGGDAGGDDDVAAEETAPLARKASGGGAASVDAAR